MTQATLSTAAPEAPDVAPPAATSPALTAVSWDQVLQLVGGLAGFAALGYGVGAAELWLRFATTGFPADVALAAVPRERILVLGFRSLLTWCVVTSLLLGAVRLASIGGRRLRERIPSNAIPDALRRHGHALAMFLAAALLAFTAFVTWSAFTVAACTLACVVFYRHYSRRHPTSPRPRAPVLIFIALVSAVATIGWQLQVNLNYDSARVTLKGEREGRISIYFGWRNDQLYASRRLTADRLRGRFARDIAVIPKDRVSSVVLLQGGQTLCTNVPRPIASLGRALHRLDRLVRQHLRARGQPDPMVRRTPKKVPAGQCPPQ